MLLIIIIFFVLMFIAFIYLKTALNKDIEKNKGVVCDDINKGPQAITKKFALLDMKNHING